MSQTWLHKTDSPVQDLSLCRTWLGFHIAHKSRCSGAVITGRAVTYYTTSGWVEHPWRRTQVTVQSRTKRERESVKFTYGTFPGEERTGCSPLVNWDRAFNLALSSKRLACSWRGLRGRSLLVTIHLKPRHVEYSVGFLRQPCLYYHIFTFKIYIITPISKFEKTELMLNWWNITVFMFSMSMRLTNKMCVKL